MPCRCESEPVRNGRILVLVVAAVALLTASAGAPAGTFTDNQSFDTEASAQSAGWTENGSGVAPHNYGYAASPSNFAGGANLGEAGGDLHLTANRTYYADQMLNGTLAVTDALTGSGKFEITNSNTNAAVMYLAHFRAADNGLTNILGMLISDNNSTSIRMRAVLHYDGGGTDQGSLITVPIAGLDRFEYLYNPDPDNNPLTTVGVLTATLYDTSNVAYTSTTPTTTTLAVNLDAFGLRTQALGGFEGSNPLVMFVDDVFYTSIPEPASVGGLVTSLALLSLSRRRR